MQHSLEVEHQILSVHVVWNPFNHYCMSGLESGGVLQDKSLNKPQKSHLDCFRDTYFIPTFAFNNVAHTHILYTRACMFTQHTHTHTHTTTTITLTDIS